MMSNTGMLYFFFNEETLDTYPSARGSWCVLHYDGDITHLRRGLASSDEQQLIYPACAITFSTTLTLPPFESLYLERLGLSYDAYRREAPLEQRREVDAYVELTQQLEAFYESVSPYHQFLGHPCQVQGDLLLECQRGRHSKGDLADWRLLLQV